MQTSDHDMRLSGDVIPFQPKDGQPKRARPKKWLPQRLQR